MRWDELFSDLESQLEQELAAERLDLAAEEERLRLGRIVFRDRLLAMSRGGEGIRIAWADGEVLRVRVNSVGRDWVAGEAAFGEARRTVLVPLGALVAALPEGEQLERGLRVSPEDSGAALSAQLGLAFVLRDLCRRRAALEVCTALGAHHGTIDRVSRDHLDLAEHDAETPRRERVVRRVRLVPFGAIRCIRLA